MKLRLRLIAVDIAGLLVSLAFRISPQLEKTLREAWGREYARKQLSEIEAAYEAHKLEV